MSVVVGNNSGNNSGNVVAYARVSTQGQDDNGLSLVAQMRRIIDYVSSTLAGFSIYQIQEVIRAKFTRTLVDDLDTYRKNNVKAIIICRVDRFSRNVVDGLEMAQTILDADICLIFIDHQLAMTKNNFSGIVYDKFLSLLQSAEYESEQSSLRIKSSKQECLNTGRFLGGKPSYGIQTYEMTQMDETTGVYRIIVKCQPNVEELKVVRFIDICRSNNYTTKMVNTAMENLGVQVKPWPIELLDDDGNVITRRYSPMPNKTIAALLNEYGVRYRNDVLFTSTIIKSIKSTQELAKYYINNVDLLSSAVADLGITNRPAKRVYFSTPNKRSLSRPNIRRAIFPPKTDQMSDLMDIDYTKPKRGRPSKMR